MSYKENYRKILEEYKTKYLTARESAENRRQEVEARLPEVAAVDRLLAGIGPEIMRVSLQAGENEQSRRAGIEALKAKNEALLRRRAELLTAAGYPADYTEVRYECPRCGDTGILDDGGVCSCLRRKLIAASYEASGLGELLNRQTFDNFSLDYFRGDEKAMRIMTSVLHTLRDYAEHFTMGDDTHEPSGNLLLVGGTGLGKTHLSSAVAKTVLDRGYDVLYASAPTMVATFESERFRNAAAITAGIDDPARFFDCDLLILDDLGTEVSNQFTLSALHNVINTRLNLRHPTIISTNLFQGELNHRYWDRIASRLFGEYQILLFLGTDVRAQKIRKS